MSSQNEYYKLYSDLEMHLINIVINSMIMKLSVPEGLNSMPMFTVGNQLKSCFLETYRKRFSNAAYSEAEKAAEIGTLGMLKIRMVTSHASMHSIMMRSLARLDKEIGYKFPSFINEVANRMLKDERMRSLDEMAKYVHGLPTKYGPCFALIKEDQETKRQLKAFAVKLVEQIYSDLCDVSMWKFQSLPEVIQQGTGFDRCMYYQLTIKMMIGFVLAEIFAQELVEHYHPKSPSSLKSAPKGKESAFEYTERREVNLSFDEYKKMRAKEAASVSEIAAKSLSIDNRKLAEGLLSIDEKVAAAWAEPKHIAAREVTNEAEAELAKIRAEKMQAQKKKEAEQSAQKRAKSKMKADGKTSNSMSSNSKTIPKK